MIPILIGSVTALTAGYGAKKVYDAKEKNERADKIVARAEKKYKKEKKILEKKRDILNFYIQNFAKFKMEVYTKDIQRAIKLAKRCKQINSNFKNHTVIFTMDELNDMQNKVDLSTEIANGLLKGAFSGTLTAFGVYGSVTLLGTASTGTAISTLSGVAARNATLAWLGGGSISAGGFGMAGGAVALGGIVIAPLIAVVGSTLDSQAEKNLTKAKEYKAEVDVEVEKMQLVKQNLDFLHQRINELQRVIKILRNKLNHKYSFFYNLSSKNSLCKNENFIEYLYIAKKLKEALEIDLIDEKGELTSDFNKKLERIKL